MQAGRTPKRVHADFQAPSSSSASALAEPGMRGQEPACAVRVRPACIDTPVESAHTPESPQGWLGAIARRAGGLCAQRPWLQEKCDANDVCRELSEGFLVR